MPGSLFTLECSDCRAQFEISTGVGFSPEHKREWRYEQRVCPKCQVLESHQAPDLWEQGEGCSQCGGELVDWTGRIWHERLPDGMVGAEHVEGPCPRCSGPLEVSPFKSRGLWD
jgi:hypothetical protein